MRYAKNMILLSSRTLANTMAGRTWRLRYAAPLRSEADERVAMFFLLTLLLQLLARLMPR